MIWWILPAISGVIGLMLVFAGFGRVFGMQVFSGGARLLFGTGFMGLGGVIAFAGLNLQTYMRIAKETEVTRISFESTELPDTYLATLTFPGGEKQVHELTGDEWEIRARVIRFQPLANMLGYDSVYRLDRLTGGFEEADGETTVIVRRLNANPGLDVHAMAKAEGARFGMNTESYGSAVYNPMADGLTYDVKMTQGGLVLESADLATRSRVGQPVQPRNEDRAPGTPVPAE
ncbi:MAG: hypothetical protein AAF216_03355 [Pseudomonadota bacterium]